MSNKLPLENKQLERSIIGTLISDTTTFWTVKDRVKAELFTLPIHQVIVGILHKLAEAGREFSIPSILARLPHDDANKEFSPTGYLATLVAEEADASAIYDNFADLEDMWARRKMISLGEELIRTSRDDNGMSAIERLEAAKNRVEMIADPLGSKVKHMKDVSARLLARVQDASMTERTTGIDVGLKAMQDLTGPLMPTRLYVIAGPPGSGKSALAVQVGTHVSRERNVLIESLEMGDEELAERDLAGRTGISADKIERASVNVTELEHLFIAAEEHRKLGLYIDSSSGLTITQIRSKAMRLKRLEGLDLLVIDHLLYIQRPDRKMGEFEGIRANMQGAKKMATDLGIPVILLTQLKKEFGEGPWNTMRRPNVNDLYGGSSVEQEADVILFVHRPEYLLKRKEPDTSAKDFGDWSAAVTLAEGKAELVLGKRRGGAATGIRVCYFDGPRVRFSDQPPRLPLANDRVLDEAARLF